jgi:hypothetical protein
MQKRRRVLNKCAHYRQILVTPLRTNAGDIFDVYLSNLTNTHKVKDIWT